ncbi:MFS family permease [Anaerosolibacter carboniphilus]|uniref:MFS family permease n=1 Tax=Anaerosolibacter carboniphilus TaxID=1417629 RepID=A0A841KY69_9FIRM|nr:MFS transporter [Anaerosolibacter carboniphilus]MBB6217248.1 MFS family permease [Anaerosolibacter carboniphilus]
MKKFLGPYKDLPNNVFVIFFARMVNSAGHFVMPFMAMFLSNKLGLSTEKTGYFMMLAAFAYVPGSFIGGKLADHLGRKKIFILFQSLAALSFIPCAFLGNSTVIPWLLILSSLFGGAAGPANGAMVADLTNSTNRKEAYSLLYLGHNLGFAVGPMVAGLLYKNHLPWIFIGDALTTFLSLILVAVFIPETRPDEEKIAEIHDDLEINERAEGGSLLSAMIKRPVLMTFLFCIMLYSFVYVQHLFTLPMQMQQFFGDDQGAKYYGFIMATNALTVVIFTTLVTKLTLKLKPIFCVALGGIFYAAGFGMLSSISHLYLFIFSTFVWTLGEILVSTNGMAYVANNTPVTHRGRFNAIVPIIAEAGHALGPLWTGKYLMTHRVLSVWQLTLYGAFFIALLLFALHYVENGRTQKLKQEEM